MKILSLGSRFLPVVAAMALLFSLTGCKKSAEGETKRWSQNSGFLDTYAGEYANMKAAIAAHKASAAEMFEKAKAQGGEDGIKAMDAANDKARELINPIQSYQSAAKEAAKLKNDKYVRKNSPRLVRSAREKANEALNEAAAIIADAEVATAEEAIAKFKQAKVKVSNGMRALKTLKKKGKKKKKK